MAAIGGDDLELRVMDDLRERASQWVADEEERPGERTVPEILVEGFGLLVTAGAVLALEVPRGMDAIFERLDAIHGRLPS